MNSPHLKCITLVLFILRLLGCCPLALEKNKTKSKFVFNCSLEIFASLAVALMAFCLPLIYVTHTGFGYDWLLGRGVHYTASLMEEQIRNSIHLSQKEKDWNLSCLKTVVVLAAGQTLVYLAASLKNRHVLPSLLNSWSELEYKLCSVLQDGGQQPQLCMKTRTPWWCNAVIALAILISFLPPAIIASSVPDHQDYWVEVSFICTVWTYMGLMESLHDLVLILSFKELRNHFTQISKNLEVSGWKRKELTVDHVDRVTEVVLAIRQQSQIVCDYLAPAQLPSLLYIMTACTLCMFSALLVQSGGTTWGEGNDLKITVGNAASVLGITLRLYYKSSLGQQITNEEQTLALKLTILGLNSSQIVGQKVKSLVDLMMQKPCEINLSNIVVLRRKLLPRMFGQIATYLIVVMQFYNSK